MYSNWLGTSGWGVIDDPTGVLNGKVLVAKGLSDSRERVIEILQQDIGTSSAFTLKNYEVVCNYAFPQDWDFQSGTFTVYSRAKIDGSTFKIINAYFAEIDVGTRNFRIGKIIGGQVTEFNESDLDDVYITRNFRHNLCFKTFGTTSVNFILEIDGVQVCSYGDASSNVMGDGFPGIGVSKGTIYVDTFFINRYTQDGLEPTDWNPLNFATPQFWVKDEGRTLSGDFLSQWDDQSGNTNHLTSTGTAMPLATTTLNELPNATFQKTSGSTSPRTYSLYTGASAFRNIQLSTTGIAPGAGTAFTISMWIYMRDGYYESNNRTFWSTNASSGSFTNTSVYLRVSFVYSRFEIKVRNAVNLDDNDLYYTGIDPNTLTDGWHLFTVTFDGVAWDSTNHIYFYIDGVLNSSSSSMIRNDSVDQFALFAPTQLTLLSSLGTTDNSTTDCHECYIADCTFFSVQLTNSEVQELYNSGSYFDPTTHSQSANLTSWWKFDDLGTSVINTNDATIEDVQGSNDVSTTVSSISSSFAWNSTYKGPSGTGTAASYMTAPDSGTLDYFSTGISCFMVVSATQQPSGGLGQVLIDKGTSYKVTLKQNRVLFDNGTEFGSAAEQIFPTNSASVVSIVTNKSSSASVSDGIYSNGIVGVTLTGINVGADNTDRLYVGTDASVTLNKSLVGTISEMIFYQSEVNQDTRQKMEGYLAHKWGIENMLPQSHPYKSIAPKVGD